VLPWASAEILQWGKGQHFACPFQVDDMQC